MWTAETGGQDLPPIARATPSAPAGEQRSREPELVTEVVGGCRHAI